MTDATVSPLDRVRNPEYTGENRCLPCTAVNVAIAAVASGLIAVVSPELAAAAFALSLLLVYLRGYLVPGTPTLTKRYLPDRVLALFDSHPAATNGTETEWETLEKVSNHRENAVDVDRFLADEDVLRPSENGDGCRLTDDVAESLDRRVTARYDGGVDRETLAVVFDVDPDAVSFEDREYPAADVDHRIRKWPSETALVADVAAHEILAEQADDWADVPLEQRVEMLAIVRSYHETCPACGGEFERTADSVESCCRSHEVVTIRCVDCGDRLLERSPDALGSTRLGESTGTPVGNGGD